MNKCHFSNGFIAFLKKSSSCVYQDSLKTSHKTCILEARYKDLTGVVVNMTGHHWTPKSHVKGTTATLYTLHTKIFALRVSQQKKKKSITNTVSNVDKTTKENGLVQHVSGAFQSLQTQSNLNEQETVLRRSLRYLQRHHVNKIVSTGDLKQKKKVFYLK